jgi:hypothetical protein
MNKQVYSFQVDVDTPLPLDGEALEALRYDLGEAGRNFLRGAFHETTIDVAAHSVRVSHAWKLNKEVSANK